MTLATMNFTALAVAGLYYFWRDGYAARLRRSKLIRERVAYMLWTAAHHVA
ncbi:MAG: hypothetical protein U0746_20520 [Gemmataceae bacterium]